MKCYKKYNYFDYLEGNLTIQEKTLYDEHFAHCIVCKNNIAQISNFLKSHESLKNSRVNPFIYTRIEQKLIDKNKKEIALLKWQPYIISILSIIAISAGILIGSHFSSKTSNNFRYLYWNDNSQEYIEYAFLNK